MNLMWYFSGGDAGFYFIEQLKQLSWLPVAWHPEYGFGVSTVSRLWFDYPYLLFVKILYSIGFSWWFIDKLLWAAVLILGVHSAYKLALYILGNKKAALLASVIYISNTYILLLFGGGQIGVSLAYAFAPFLFYRIMKYSKVSIKEHIINGLCLALLIAFDLRIAFLVVAATVFWWYRSLIFLFVAASVHLFWILPIVLARGGISDLGEQFTSPGMLKFLSVADFSHALSLLHPNWPENLFGKVYFMQAEFLIIPLIAFASLLMKEGQETINNKQEEGQETINNKQKKRLLFTAYCPFFAFLALLGAFLAKGVNEPFGGIYAWMFIHVPGFVMFRDPTKFYLYIAIGYSVLIPYVLKKVTGYGLRVTGIAFIIFWLFTIRALLTGQVEGNFRPTRMPQEYVQLKDLLVADTVPSRTLWIPQKENYAYFSDMHPVLATESAFVKDPLFIQKISEMGVRYVIVPIDVNKRLFLNDYRFDPSQRDALVETLGKTSLVQNTAFLDIAVFENDRFVFEQTTPAVVVRQLKLANTGLAISAIAIVLFLGYLLRERWTISSKQ